MAAARKLKRERKQREDKADSSFAKRFWAKMPWNKDDKEFDRRTQQQKLRQEVQDDEQNYYEDESGYANTYLYAPDQYTTDLTAQFRMPLLTRPNAWRLQDPDFIDKMRFEPCCSRNWNVRKKFAISTNYRFIHPEPYNKPDKSEDQKKRCEALIKFLISPRWFKLQQFLEISEEAIGSGIEGAYLGYEDIDGAICPTSVKHIDGRRFDLYQDDDRKFHYGIKIPQDIKAMKLHPLADGASKVRAFNADEKLNLLIFIYNQLESARGFGFGEWNPAWIVWRFIAWLWWFIQNKTEKHGLPLIGLSPHKKMRRKKSGTDKLPGTEVKSYLRDLMNQLKELQAGGIVISPFPADISLIDVGAGKLPELIKLMEFLLQVIGDLMLGSHAINMTSEAAYSAHRSQSNFAQKFIYYDRLFHEDCVNRLLMPRLYVLNPELFQQIGYMKFYDVPILKFVEGYSLEEKERLEMILDLQKAGYKVSPEQMGEVADMQVEQFDQQAVNQAGSMETTRSKYDY